MKATVLYRIASVLLVVAAAGNTYGALNGLYTASRPLVSIQLGHTGLSFAQIVLGLDLFCSLCVLFGAYLAWHLGWLARTTPRAIGALGWGLFGYQLVGVYVSWIALSGFVKILFLILAFCLGWAAWLSTPRRQQRIQNGGTLESPA